MTDYPIPERVVLDAEGMRMWAHIVCFEPGRLWVYPSESHAWGFGDALRVVIWVDGHPRLGMAAQVGWTGSETLALDVRHEVDVALTRAWWRGRAFDLGRLRCPPVQVRAA